MKSTLRRAIAVIILSSAGVLFQACGPVYDMYCNIRAHFVSDVLSVSPTLYRSCTSLGEFCTITNPAWDARRLHFNSIGTSDTYNLTALLDRTVVLGLGGLIVGLPSIPDQFDEEPKVVCYDLTCPYCYEEYNISHLLQYKRIGYVDCTSCGHSYNLNNGIAENSDEPIRPLFRYRVNYFPETNTLRIENP
ncbi:MAG: hypothetical protein J6U46_01285 [Bacteroidaceae bacterium]|nr:hypothetical protein [Bacteroidaceae bacterium]